MRLCVLLFLSATIVYPQTIQYQNPLLPFIFFNGLEIYQEQTCYSEASDSSRFFSRFNINQIYLEKKGSKTLKDYGYWNFASGIHSSVLLAGQKYYIQYAFERNKKFLLSKTEPDQLQYLQQFSAHTFSFKTPLFWDTISFDSHLRKKNTADPEYGLGFSIVPREYLSLRYGYGYFINDWKMQSSNANGAIDILFKEHKKSHDFRARWAMKNIILSASYQTTAINKDEAPENGTVALPQGSERLFKLKAVLDNLFEIDEWHFTYSNFYSNTKGSFYDVKDKFGDITRKKSSYQEYSLGLSKSFNVHTLGVEISAGQTELALNGSINTGPFTDFWLAFLGLRHLMKSELDYSHVNSTLKYSYAINQTSSWDFSVGHEFLKTADNSFLRTWQAEIIIPRNIRNFNLGDEQQHGLYIGSKIFYTVLANVALSYEISQYIPIDTKSGSKGTSRSKNKNFIYGGGQHLLQLHIAL